MLKEKIFSRISQLKQEIFGYLDKILENSQTLYVHKVRRKAYANVLILVVKIYLFFRHTGKIIFDVTFI